jgi:hypothetical protein
MDARITNGLRAAAIALVVGAVALGIDRGFALAQGVVDAFDHVRTGFLLEGKHASIACESCHSSPNFAAVPRTCSECHNGLLAEGMGFRHIPTSIPCDQCHTPLDWRTSRFDHTSVVAGCVRCHNNFLAPGKTLNHPITDEVCETCHNTVHWNQILRAPSLTGGTGRAR